MGMETTNRFSNRVENYVKYRPRYPEAAIDYIMRVGNLSRDSTIADVGCGTGFSAEPFAQRGCNVYGLEPNDAMRAAAEELLVPYPNFHSRNATAEQTGLTAGAVDAILCAQAFHWFDQTRAQMEFRRIAKPKALLVLMWNARLTNTPFLAAYDRLLQTYATDYNQVNHENITDAEIRQFIGHEMQTATFPNEQRFTLEGLFGRLLSSSYVPTEGQTGHSELFAGVSNLFQEHQKEGQVSLLYETRVYSGRLN